MTFTTLCAQPTIAALQHENRVKAQHKVSATPTADERYARVLGEIEEQSKKAKRNRGQGKSSKPQAKEIRKLEGDLRAIEADIDASFKATERHLNDRNLADVIKQRHRDAVATYEEKRAQFKALVGTLTQADDRDIDAERDVALSALTTFFDQHPQARKRAPLDPTNLPWRTPKKEVRAPITNPDEFKTAQFGYATTKASGSVLPRATAPKLLPAAPTPEDLAETQDVQITPQIRDLAIELEKNPVKIYDWVRNNVDSLPSYGSIQGSAATLAKREGNPFDIASLLIALLRASDVPARYVYGTVESPVTQVMNWVGGVVTADAALALMGQGGIPSAPRIVGGSVVAIRFEHVWVEAWADFSPSRGASQRQGDSWVPIDASYKQYSFSQGVDLNVAVPFDVQAFHEAARQGATLDRTDGWIQNINVANVQLQRDVYESRVIAYLAAQMPASTVRDRVGARQVLSKTATHFAGTLPYRVVALGVRISQLPQGLRHQFRYSLFATPEDRAQDSPAWTFQRPTSSLAGNNLTIVFTPASDADRDLIASYLPQPHQDGTPVQLSELPSAIPAYANVTAELHVGGETVARGGTFRLGAELSGNGGFTMPSLIGWDLTPDETLVAGQTSAIGISLHGVSPAQLEAASLRIQSTRTKLQSADYGSLTVDLVTGDLLSSAIATYFASIEARGPLTLLQRRVIDRPGLSYGLFHAAVQPNKLYGVVTVSVRFPGVMLDVGHLRHMRVAIDGNRDALLAHNRSRGLEASALETRVPELFFVDKATCSSTGGPLPICPEAVSTAKAISVAASEGQKIYSISSTNTQAINALQISSHIVEDIENAVGAGKEVLVHERPISVGGWTGAAYVVFDPESGAGGYFIEGGANGGNLTTLDKIGFACLIVATIALVIALVLVLTELIVVAGAAYAASQEAAMAGYYVEVAVFSRNVRITSEMAAKFAEIEELGITGFQAAEMRFHIIAQALLDTGFTEAEVAAMWRWGGTGFLGL